MKRYLPTSCILCRMNHFWSLRDKWFCKEWHVRNHSQRATADILETAGCVSDKWMIHTLQHSNFMYKNVLCKFSFRCKPISWQLVALLQERYGPMLRVRLIWFELSSQRSLDRQRSLVVCPVWYASTGLHKKLPKWFWLSLSLCHCCRKPYIIVYSYYLQNDPPQNCPLLKPSLEMPPASHSQNMYKTLSTSQLLDILSTFLHAASIRDK